MDIHKQILHEPCGFDEEMTRLAIRNVRFAIKTEISHFKNACICYSYK